MTSIASNETEPQADRPAKAAPSPWGKRLQVVIGIGVSAVCLWAFLRGVDWNSLSAVFTACPRGPLVGLAVFTAALQAIRSWRWLALLVPYGIGYRYALQGVMLSTAANNVLPARAGEVVRATVLSSECGVPLASLMVTVVVERLLDLAAVAGLALWAAAWSAGRAGGGSAAWAATAGGLAGATAVVMGVLVGLALSARGGEIKWLRRLPERWQSPVERVLRQISQAVLVDTRPAQLVQACLRTVLLWGVAGLWVHVGLEIVGVGVGLAGAYLVLTAILAGISVPSAPGFVGTYHLSCMMALTWLGTDREHAVAAAVLLHGVSFLVTTAWGGLEAARLALRPAAK